MWITLIRGTLLNFLKQNEIVLQVTSNSSQHILSSPHIYSFYIHNHQLRVLVLSEVNIICMS